MCQKVARDAGTLANRNKIKDRFQKMVSGRVLGFEYNPKLIMVQEKKDPRQQEHHHSRTQESLYQVLLIFLFRRASIPDLKPMIFPSSDK